MFYVSEVKDFNNVSIVDTTDNSVEVYSYPQISAFEAAGISIGGVEGGDVKEILNADTCWSWYSGEYIGAAEYGCVAISMDDETWRGMTIRRGIVIGYIPYPTRYSLYNLTNDILLTPDNGTQFRYVFTDRMRSSVIGNLDYEVDAPANFSRVVLFYEKMFQPQYMDGFVFDKVLNVVNFQPCTGTRYFVIQRVFDSEMRVLNIICVHIDKTSRVQYGIKRFSIEEFYKLLKNSPSSFVNAKLDGNFVVYSGLDGKYCIDMDIVKKAFCRYEAKDSVMSRAKNKLLTGEDGNQVLANGELVSAVLTGDSLVIPEGVVTINEKAWSGLSHEDRERFMELYIPSTLRVVERSLPYFCVTNETIVTYTGDDFKILKAILPADHFKFNLAESNVKVVFKYMLSVARMYKRYNTYTLEMVGEFNHAEVFNEVYKPAQRFFNKCDKFLHDIKANVASTSKMTIRNTIRGMEFVVDFMEMLWTTSQDMGVVYKSWVRDIRKRYNNVVAWYGDNRF